MVIGPALRMSGREACLPFSRAAREGEGEAGLAPTGRSAATTIEMLASRPRLSLHGRGDKISAEKTGFLLEQERACAFERQDRAPADSGTVRSTGSQAFDFEGAGGAEVHGSLRDSKVADPA